MYFLELVPVFAEIDFSPPHSCTGLNEIHFIVSQLILQHQAWLFMLYPSLASKVSLRSKHISHSLCNQGQKSICRYHEISRGTQPVLKVLSEQISCQFGYWYWLANLTDFHEALIPIINQSSLSCSHDQNMELSLGSVWWEKPFSILCVLS